MIVSPMRQAGRLLIRTVGAAGRDHAHAVRCRHGGDDQWGGAHVLVGPHACARESGGHAGGGGGLGGFLGGLCGGQAGGAHRGGLGGNGRLDGGVAWWPWWP